MDHQGVQKKKKTKTKGESYTCTMRRSEVRGVEYNQKHALWGQNGGSTPRSNFV